MLLYQMLKVIFKRTFQPRYFLPSMSRLVVFIFIFTNIAFAYKPQESVWEKRGKSSDLTLASLPLAPPIPHLNQILPHKELGHSPRKPNSFSFLKEIKSRQNQPKIVSNLPTSFFNHVTLRKVHPQKKGGTIILLEDIHKIFHHLPLKKIMDFHTAHFVKLRLEK